MSPTPLLNSGNYCLTSYTTEQSIMAMGTVSSSIAVIATTTGGGGGPFGNEYILIGVGCGIGLLLCLISTLCIGLICYKCSMKISE